MKKLETVSQDLKKFADELELDIHNDITTDDIFKIGRQLKDSHREHLIKKYSHRRLVKAFLDILNKYHTKKLRNNASEFFSYVNGYNKQEEV